MSYAKLGVSCYSSMRVLTDNRKFLNVDANVYDIYYTKSHRYPASIRIPETTSSGDGRPEDLKVIRNTQQKEKQEEEYGCISCGKK